MSRRKAYAPPRLKTTFGLNITSMTDMFTILLVFLLQTFSTSDVEIVPINGMNLPSTTSNLNPIEGVRINLSKEELKIGDHLVASLQGKQFLAKDVDAKDPNFLPLLFNELNELAKNPDNKEFLKEGRLLLQADVSLPYDTLRKVLYTASMAGFPQLKMVAMLAN